MAAARGAERAECLRITTQSGGMGHEPAGAEIHVRDLRRICVLWHLPKLNGSHDDAGRRQGAVNPLIVKVAT
jgi:hypothetical protein